MKLLGGSVLFEWTGSTASRDASGWPIPYTGKHAFKHVSMCRDVELPERIRSGAASKELKQAIPNGDEVVLGCTRLREDNSKLNIKKLGADKVNLGMVMPETSKMKSDRAGL